MIAAFQGAIESCSNAVCDRQWKLLPASDHTITNMNVGTSLAGGPFVRIKSCAPAMVCSKVARLVSHVFEERTQALCTAAPQATLPYERFTY